MVKVKICGITNLPDAVFSVKEGADALGFNFYPKSPRYIAPFAAAEVISSLPREILLVGVFVNETIDNIVEIAASAGLNAVQLHGDEGPDFVRELRKVSDLKIIKALRVKPGFKPSDAEKYPADAILLDAFSASEYGGTGETFDWEVAKSVKQFTKELLLAGGLTPENIANAIRSVAPAAVDACSGLEKSKGVKDYAKIKAFMENARRKI